MEAGFDICPDEYLDASLLMHGEWMAVVQVPGGAWFFRGYGSAVANAWVRVYTRPPGEQWMLWDRELNLRERWQLCRCWGLGRWQTLRSVVRIRQWGFPASYVAVEGGGAEALAAH